LQKHLLVYQFAFEVNHKGKKFGFVHGHIEQNNWDEFKETFTQEPRVSRDPSN
jgi:serine/threonine protein phosphatase 1